MKVAMAATLDPGSGGPQFHLSETIFLEFIKFRIVFRGFQLLCSGFGGLCVRLLKLHVAEQLKVASRFWDGNLQLAFCWFTIALIANSEDAMDIEIPCAQ